MFPFLKARWKFFVVPGLILIASLVWISSSKQEKDRNLVDRLVVTATAPFERAISWTLSGVKHVWYGYLYFVGVVRANQTLRQENDELRARVALDWEIQAQNDRLRKDLAFAREMPGKLMPATVIGADVSGWATSIRINRGSRDGIARNMAVVTPSGVLGRVIEVSPFYADVQLITDVRSAVSVRVQRTRAQGILEGLSRGICHLKYVARAEDVQAGDVVVTSGLGGIFPRGLVVGTVVDVEKKEFGVLQEVRVAPAVDFDRLPEEVLVVVEAPPAPPEPEQKPQAKAS